MDVINSSMIEEDDVLLNIMKDNDLDIIPDINESPNTSALEKFINNCYSELKNKEKEKKDSHINNNIPNSIMICQEHNFCQNQLLLRENKFLSDQVIFLKDEIKEKKIIRQLLNPTLISRINQQFPYENLVFEKPEYKNKTNDTLTNVATLNDIEHRLKNFTNNNTKNNTNTKT